MTRVSAAIAAAAPTLGIIWEGFLVHEPNTFQKLAAASSVENFEPHLWIAMRVNDNGDGSFTFLTAGMDLFGLLEIEIDSHGDWHELNRFGMGLVNHMLKRGVPIPDGETVGRSEQEKLRITHAPGRWASGNVIKVKMRKTN